MTYKYYSEEIESIEALKQSASLDRFVEEPQLKVKSLANAIILPSTGVYHNGCICPESFWGGVVSNDIQFDANSQEIVEDDSEVYYLGTFHICWGHEITDGMRLLWGIVPELGGIALNDKVKYAYTLCSNDHPLPQNFIMLLESFGVDKQRLVKIDAPTRFKKVYLADESYWYDITTDTKRTFGSTFRQLYEILCHKVVPVKKEPTRTVYLSRSGWHKGNPDFGEAMVERAFVENMNCEVYRPENLSFVEMVRLLQETKTLIATEGSISHNALFLQPGTKLIILRKAGFISYYQLMINQLKDLEVTYIDAHRTHHFTHPIYPYYGPFFLLVNKSLSDFLGIKPQFPIKEYVRYRSEVCKRRSKNLLFPLLARVKHKFIPPKQSQKAVVQQRTPLPTQANICDAEPIDTASTSLVSIVVVTYNSSKYVADTLQSVFSQTYGNLEVIVSDDSSTDNTIELCRLIIDKYQRETENHNKCKIIKTPKNVGISANYNFALRHCKGKYIKYIAGDDLLEPDCIEEFVKAAESTGKKFLVCYSSDFTIDGPAGMHKYPKWCYDQSRQYRAMVLHDMWVHGPTIFLERDTLLKLGGFDERFPYLEDYPLAMKYLHNGYFICLVDKALVRHRMYPESVSKSNLLFQNNLGKAIAEYTPLIAWRCGLYLHWWNELIIRHLHRHNYPQFVRTLMVSTSPLYLKKKLGQE